MAVPPVWHPGPMSTEVLFAGVATADLGAATAWYEAFLGRPHDTPVVDPEGNTVNLIEVLASNR